MGKIVLNQVQKKFGDVEVIPPLDLTIEEGEFTVFVGPSGCGKSTLLRLIAGLEDVTAGSIQIDGQETATLPPAKRGLAMVFQSYALYPHMTVRKNIAFPLKMAKMDKAEIDRRVANAAEVLNLTDFLDIFPHLHSCLDCVPSELNLCFNYNKARTLLEQPFFAVVGLAK